MEGKNHEKTCFFEPGDENSRQAMKIQGVHFWCKNDLRWGPEVPQDFPQPSPQRSPVVPKGVQKEVPKTEANKPFFITFPPGDENLEGKSIEKSCFFDRFSSKR